MKGIAFIGVTLILCLQSFARVGGFESVNDRNSWKLEQNFPNPFNPQTIIHYTVPTEISSVTIRIVDAAGRFVREYQRRDVLLGNYSYTWDGRDEGGISVASGVYFYWLTADNVQFKQKMVFMR